MRAVDGGGGDPTQDTSTLGAAELYGILRNAINDVHVGSERGGEQPLWTGSASIDV